MKKNRTCVYISESLCCIPETITCSNIKKFKKQINRWWFSRPVTSNSFCNYMDYSLPRLLCPFDFPGRTTGVGCHFLFQGISQPGIEHVSWIGRQILFFFFFFKLYFTLTYCIGFAGRFFTTDPPGKPNRLLG